MFRHQVDMSRTLYPSQLFGLCATSVNSFVCYFRELGVSDTIHLSNAAHKLCHTFIHKCRNSGRRSGSANEHIQQWHDPKRRRCCATDFQHSLINYGAFFGKTVPAISPLQSHKSDVGAYVASRADVFYSRY